MKRRYPMHCLFRSNVGDFKMTSLMSYKTITERILGYKIFHRKLVINTNLTRKDNVEYIIAKTDLTRRHQKCYFHWLTPFRFTFLTR